MPCRYDDGLCDNSDKLNTMQKELDTITAILCAICSKLESDYHVQNELWNIPNLNTWWKKHKISDEVREQKERLRIETEKERLDKQIAVFAKQKIELDKQLNKKQLKKK